MAPLHTEKTSTGLEANLAAALSYLVGFVTGIIFLLVEKDNKFVRFHAMQSILLSAGFTVLWIVGMIANYQTIRGIPPNYQQALLGGILLLAILTDRLFRGRSS